MGDQMQNLKDPESLVESLQKAAAKKSSSEEILEQRVSFVMSSTDGVTRTRVRQVIYEQEGREA